MKRLAVAALGGGLVVFLLFQPHLVLGLRSPRVLAWIAAGAIICVVISRVARRLGATPLLALSLAAIPALVAFGLVVVKPIVSPRELTEALPTVADATTASPSPSSSPSPSPAPKPLTPVVTAAPVAIKPPAPRPTTAAPVKQPVSQPAQQTAQQPAATGPARVASGRLTPLSGHSARGQVSTYRLADGSHIIRFENVSISGTPDPQVYLLPGRNRTGKSGGLYLGALKAERGSFNYRLPARFVGTDFTVLVWCGRYAVDIAHSTQA